MNHDMKAFEIYAFFSFNLKHECRKEGGASYGCYIFYALNENAKS